ncbi:MAG: cadherin-like beta sandwich domain-containing protein, partial [Candidatus Phytoplasma sp.]|nr:cadherin-like beta sandwich domain-containing protein [Phytoplasma sp.]
MRKIRIIISLILMTMVLLILFPKSYGLEDQYAIEFYLANTANGSTEINDISELKPILYEGKYYFEIDLMAKGVGGDVKLSGFELELTGKSLESISKITTAKYKYNSGPPFFQEESINVWNANNSSNAPLLMSVILTDSYKNIDINVDISESGTKLLTLMIVNDGSTDFDIGLDFGLYGGASWRIDSASVVEYTNYALKKLTVGNPNSGPNSNLSSLEITGASNTKYETSIGEVLLETQPIELTYQDSLKELNIKTTKEKASATQEIHIKRNGKLIPHSTAIPYQTGDELIITVTDGESVTPYIRPITVEDPSSNTEIELTTDKPSEISKEESGDFTIKVSFSVTDLTITVIPLEFATASKTTIELTQLSVIDPHVETITITAEDGTTKKPVTITVIREKGNDDKTIDLKVNGETVLGNDHLILEEIDTFTLTATPNVSTTKVEYSYDNGQSYSSKNLPQTLIKGEEKIVYIKITSEDGTSEIRQIKVSREKSSNTELKNLMIKEDGFDEVSLVYNAQKGAYEYILKSNDSSNVVVTTYDQEKQIITLKNKDRQVIDKIIKKGDLVFGENQFYIHVQAENGKDFEEYSLIIIKQSDLKDIIGLEIQDMDKNYATIVKDVDEFVRSGNDFSYELAYAQTSKIRLIITSSERSTIKNSYNSNNEHYVDFTFTSTNKQDHFIAIEVKAENGTIGNYTITITRKEADSNNFLTDIKVNNISVPEFSKEKFEGYKTMVLDRNQNSVNFQVTKESTLSTVEYFVAGQKQSSSQIPLEPGVLKEVEIRVTAENKKPQSYYINVIAGSRLNEITNINLSNIPATLFTFNSKTYVYNISVPYTTEFTKVTATASPYAKISGLATYDLEEGKTVSFDVYATSESQEESEIKYTFNITRQEARTYKNLEELEVEIDGKSTVLNPHQTDPTYKIRIDQHIQNITITASVKGDQGETIVGKPGTGFEQKYSIVEGPTGTTITITVIAEDKSTKEYKIIVIRANDNNEIDFVTIDGNVHSISTFDSNNTLTLNDVPYTTDKLSFVANLVDSRAKLTYNPNLISGNWVLSEGENEITFFATSEYGTKGKEYKVVV